MDRKETGVSVGVVGLGYVGLPLAVEFAEAGHRVVGLDVDGSKVKALRAGRSYIEDIPSDRLAAVGDRIHATNRYADLAQVDAVIIAVPTPLTENREPDLQPLISAGTALAGVLQQGQLVVLESTTYPGTTRDRLAPLLEESGLRAGRRSTWRSRLSGSIPAARTSPSGPPRRSSAGSTPACLAARGRSTPPSATRSSRSRRPRSRR